MFLLLLLHFLVGSVLIASGARVGRWAFAVTGVAPLATVVWAAIHAGDVIDGRPVTERVGWVGGLDLALVLRFDAFGLVMVALVAGVGVLVCAYAIGYFSQPSASTTRLAGLTAWFAGAMLGVVVADHMLALFVFWELTSVTSYLLIGNDDRNPRARAAALQAILVTGAGGLVLLLGLVIVGRSAGTFLLSELAASPPAGGAVGAGLACVLVGAFTKSAQVPFASWLPGAMVAPTPISAYLHSATMVKAGVYLVARLAPVVAATGPWRLLVLVVGAATMITGGLRALRQHDLKLLLAYGTVSQLGLLMLLVGTGEYAIAQAGVVLLLAHGAFKAALFMVVGIVDHQAGTRDVRDMAHLRDGWLPTIATAGVCAASMAGLPPMLGFLAKEKALDGYLERGAFSGSGVVLVALVVGSVITFAYSGRFMIGLLGGLRSSDVPAASAPAPAASFVAPAVVLAAFTVAAGVVPVLIDDLVRAAMIALDPAATPSPVRLWAGFNTAFVLSLVVIATGTAAVIARRRVATAQRWASAPVHRLPSAEHTVFATLRAVTRCAGRTAAIVQNGSLAVYLAIIVSVAAFASLVPMLTEIGDLDRPAFVTTWIHVPLVALLAVAAIAAASARQRIIAVLMLGSVGYLMAGLFVAEGALDLALTQFAIETLATVLFVLVLRFLPSHWTEKSTAIAAPLRLAISVTVGVAVFVGALVATGARGDVDAPQVSDEMVARAAPDGRGNNVVNVILVDFRGLDTLGEITVLLVAAVGAAALARGARSRRGDPPGIADVDDSNRDEQGVGS